MSDRKILFNKIMLVLFLMFIALAPYLFEIYKECIEREPDEKHESWEGIIVLWDYPRFDKQNGTRYQELRDKISKFEKENPGVFIEFKPIEKDTGGIELKTAAESGTMPDVVSIGADCRIMSEEYFEPLDAYLDENEKHDYFNNVLDAVKANGKILGLPARIDPCVIIVDTDIANHAGFEYLNRQDLDCNELGKILSKMESKEIIKCEMTKETADNFSKIINDQQNRNIFLQNAGLSDISRIKPAVQIMKEISKGSEVLSVICSATDTARLQFYTGGYVKHKIFGLKSDGGKLYGECAAYAVTRQKDDEKKKMCIKLAKFLTDEESQKQLGRYHAFPVKKTAGSIYGEQSDLSKLEKLIQKGEIIFAD